MRYYWSIALCMSVMIHGFILVGTPAFLIKKNKLQEDKKVREVKLSPQKIEKILNKKEDNFKEMELPPPYVDDFMHKLMVDNKKLVSLDKPKIIEDKTREIILSDVPQDKDLKKIPAYMDYYRMIREKIRTNAYHYYDSRDRGEIFLTFTIVRNGQLEDLYLNQESVSNMLLRNIGLKSVKDAAPFPPFPEELNDYARLQFNISIYFKNN